ncbi:MAG: PAS domain-containing protein [Chloroflexia bacterium]|nr:PAS domain-containing protein [Chloroflexia bacterium]
MRERSRTWARAHLDPNTLDRFRGLAGRAGSSLQQSARAGRRWASIGSEHVTSMRSPRIEPWRLLFSALGVVIPALLLALADSDRLDTAPSVLLLMAIVLSTYIADWVGGITALVTALLCLDVLFVGDLMRLDMLSSAGHAVSLSIFTLAATCSIAVVEHLKYDRARARLEAAALRAANTALSAVEIAAAQRPAGDRDAYLRVLHSILTAMVRVNRASAGAIYLMDPERAVLVRAASYGQNDSGADDASVDDALTVPVDTGFAGQIARERRAVTIFDCHDVEGVDDLRAANPFVRAVAGVPLMGPNDHLVGVAWVGLYVPYLFAPTAIARLRALAHRTIAFMEAARLADAQDELLDRVQGHYRRLQAVIQTIPEAVMVARPPHGAIVTSNAAARRMFGILPDGHPDQRRVDQLQVYDDSGSDGKSPILRALHEGVVITSVELTVRLPDGRTIPVVGSAAPLRADDGSIDGVVGVFQDVGPLKEAERLRDEFISIVSHELRSPLTPIRGFAQVVARDLQREGNHDQHIGFLHTLQRHVDRMTRLVDDLLDVSRLRAGRLQIRRGPTDLVDLIRNVVESRNYPSDHHTVVFQTELERLAVEIDGDRIHQVLDNLVGNALKYASPGEIVVALRMTGAAGTHRSVEITVSDGGPGIPSSERAQLFAPFYRSRSASESAVPGLGLGLYISHELIEAHAGSIVVAENKEGGTTFTIQLPAPVESVSGSREALTA